jgi:putative ABC transport system permease protein
MGVIEIGLTLILVFCCALLSWRLNHQLERDLILGTFRNIIQLIFLGFALTWIFKNSTLALSLSVGMVMTLNAAIHIKSRTNLNYRGIFLDNLIAIILAIWPFALFGSYLFKNKLWWEASQFLPLLGMLLANGLSSISIGTGQFGHDIRDKKEEILSLVALGATTQEATLTIFSKCLRSAMTPNLNAMLSMGLVSIPGMMTGQVMAGISPQVAAFHQIVLMLLIICTSYLGTLAGLLSARRRMFNKLGQPCF